MADATKKTPTTAKNTKPVVVEINSDNMSIEEALTALGYEPKAESWSKKDDKAKWQEITKKKNERQVKAAKKTVNAFAISDDAKKLPAEVVSAMLRLAPTAGTRGSGGGSGKNPFMDNMRALFPKKGTSVTEIDVFVATKMGRGEMRAKVRQNLKSCEVASRMWIEFDAKKESWVLLAVGEAQPKGWLGQAIDAPEEA